MVIKTGEKINFLTAKKLANDGLKEIYTSSESLYGKFLNNDVIPVDWLAVSKFPP